MITRALSPHRIFDLSSEEKRLWFRKALLEGYMKSFSYKELGVLVDTGLGEGAKLFCEFRQNVDPSHAATLITRLGTTASQSTDPGSISLHMKDPLLNKNLV